MRSQFNRQRIVKAAAVAVLVANGVAACGNSATGSAGTDLGPLAELMGGNVSPAEARAKDLALQESMAQCMKDAGWEYKPIDYSAQFSTPRADEQLSPKEFGAKYFYGTVHNYELYELPSISGGADGSTATMPGQNFVDPNQDYVNSLSMDDQTKYYAALYGDQSNQEMTTDTVTGEQVYLPPPLEQQGCQGSAQLAVYGDQPFNNPDFSKRFEQLNQDMQNDPRVNDAEIAWSDCMYAINPDFDFGASTDVYQHLEGLIAEAKGLKVLPVDPTTHQPIGDFDASQGYSSTMDANGKEIAFVGTPKAIKSARLEELRTVEKELWQADQKCQKKVGLAEIRRTVEQELVDALVQEFPELQKNQS